MNTRKHDKKNSRKRHKRPRSSEEDEDLMDAVKEWRAADEYRIIKRRGTIRGRSI